MKIYLAHNYSTRIWLRDVITLLESNGHEVTSRWITDDTHNNSTETNALADIHDIDRADAFVLYVDQPETSRPGRGKYVEFGYAYAKHKRIYLLGNTKDCIFYHLPCLSHITNIEELIEARRGGFD